MAVGAGIRLPSHPDAWISAGRLADFPMVGSPLAFLADSLPRQSYVNHPLPGAMPSVHRIDSPPHNVIVRRIAYAPFPPSLELHPT